jgi:hypothetical protein
MGGYNLAEETMLVIWLGALFVLSGLLFLATQPIWRGRLSEARRKRASAVPRDTMKPAEPMTLEPHKPGAGFGLKENWPGLALIALGGILLLAGAGQWS